MMRTAQGAAFICRKSMQLFTLLILAPSLVLAEGAVRILSCEAVSACDADLQCRDESLQVTFRMEPVDLDLTNAGTYVIRYDDTEASMHGLSYAGPFYWLSDNRMNTLVASSETRFLWHRLDLSTAPVATIRNMDCRFLQ